MYYIIQHSYFVLCTSVIQSRRGWCRLVYMLHEMYCCMPWFGQYRLLRAVSLQQQHVVPWSVVVSVHPRKPAALFWCKIVNTDRTGSPATINAPTLQKEITKTLRGVAGLRNGIFLRVGQFTSYDTSVHEYFQELQLQHTSMDGHQNQHLWYELTHSTIAG